jgi:EAL domain-containing protein (putative c-di-GMP-specific phosphodiesterase class I)
MPDDATLLQSTFSKSLIKPPLPEYLKKLPVNILKIVSIFIRNLPHSKMDHVIVDAVGRLAQIMGLNTVAEYVESEETLQLLVEMGVTYAQGNHMGKPMPLEALQLIKNNSSLSVKKD